MVSWLQSRQRKLPVALKAFLVIFSVTLTVHNATFYGPLSLLYMCDIALFLATIGVCLERPLEVSIAAVGVIGIQLLWSVDLLLTAGGLPSLGLTGYMLEDGLPWTKRALSMFHGWLPIVLLYALSKLGYRRSAFLTWVVSCSALFLICYAIVSPPPPPASDAFLAVNINYVFGLDATGPQDVMAPELWLGVLIAGLTLLIFLPTHVVLSRCFPAAHTVEERGLRQIDFASQPVVAQDK